MADLPKNNGGSDEAGEAALVGGAAHYDLRRVASAQDGVPAEAVTKALGEWLSGTTAGVQPDSDASPRTVVPLDASNIAALRDRSQGKLDEMFSKALLEQAGKELLGGMEAVMREGGETTERRIHEMEEEQKKARADLVLAAFFAILQALGQSGASLWSLVGAAEESI